MRYPAGKSGISYTIPDTVTSIETGAFSGCSYLSSLTISVGVTSIGSYVFHHINVLTSVIFRSSGVTIGSIAFPGIDGTRGSDSLKNLYMTGGAGTYTRTRGLEDWVKQPEIQTPLVMELIEGGTFQMGSLTTESGRNTDETRHSVTLTKDFYIGKYEVTQGQYQAVMGSNPGYFTSAAADGEVQGNRPVEQVSWYDAIVFCNTLSIKEGLTPAYSINGSTDPKSWGAVPASSNSTWNAVIWNQSANGYRLPTEAEWEYACRAGTTTAYNTGTGISDTAGWYNSNSSSKTHEVGLKSANSWGLYDMHGNVNEWCWDWYASTYNTTVLTDPAGASSGTYRVYRGGSWFDGAGSLRSAYRNYYTPFYRYNSIGFRVVRSQV